MPLESSSELPLFKNQLSFPNKVSVADLLPAQTGPNNEQSSGFSAAEFISRGSLKNSQTSLDLPLKSCLKIPSRSPSKSPSKRCTIVTPKEEASMQTQDGLKGNEEKVPVQEKEPSFDLGVSSI